MILKGTQCLHGPSAFEIADRGQEIADRDQEKVADRDQEKVADRGVMTF